MTGKALIGFSHDKGDWLSAIMSWATFGGPSHVVVVSPDGKWFIESTALKNPSGVQPPAPISKFLCKPRAEVRTIPHVCPQAVWDATLTQVGKPYDWGWLLGWVVRNRRWDDPTKWTCCELFTWAMLEAGDPLFKGHTWHITPGDLYLMSSPLKEGGNDQHRD